jgi:hypothetical protein
MALLSPSPVLADPPLVTLDPAMAGGGTLEITVASVGVREGGTALYGIPVLDVVYGVVDRFDVGVLLEPVKLIQGGETTVDAMLIAAGFRWQFLSIPGIKASITPSLTYDVRSSNDPVLSIPIQFEYRAEVWRFGADLGYAAIRSQQDVWLGGVNGGWLVHERMELLFEVWVAVIDERSSRQNGWSSGFDAALTDNLHLLVGGGAGIRSRHRASLDWRFYAGLQVILPGVFLSNG